MQHHTWDQMPQEALNDKVGRRYLHGEKVMVAEIALKKGASVPEHQHEAEQVCYVTGGALKFQIEGREVIVAAGQVLVIPSDVPHSAEALEDSRAIDIFSPIRHDWINKTDDYLRK